MTTMKEAGSAESVRGWIINFERRRQRRMLRWLPPKVRAKVQGGLTLSMLESPHRVETARGTIAFTLLGVASANRATSLLTKQPDTIAWIDTFAPDSVFWDIGANVGVYSLYAALRGDLRVAAFEPAAVNYFLLTANCELNQVEDRVDCFLLGLGESRRIGRMELSQFDPGSSFSFRGKRHVPRTGRQAALILPIDEFIETYDVRCPNYIKIDVPHFTEEIIRGGAKTLRRSEVRELHIEANEASKRDQQLIELLRQYGFDISGRHGRSGAMDMTFTKRA